ncbi:hypothetical protein LTR97_010811 [Elasticomyces elasticus]|uniref:Peroxin/Ferlin domain-containing protein n=1 Tax=Elasticomyces elasticus TaxID=574655 RepID=A0AAN7VZX9_9PEZI|nr:hypothetical protein LTR97_010811 [Elasticomyces elasticus]
MSPPSSSSHNPTSTSSTPDKPNDGTTTTNPIIAPFSPNQQTASTKTGPGSRSSILVYQKSPLLVATPPQVTRALAYSHPFILPLNHIAGLLSWTTGDPWSSFLLLATFWFIVLYGDDVLRWAGPVVVVVALILGMYSRRYSPLSSTLWNSGEGKGKRRRQESEQRKSLDEILETLQTFTGRCDVLLDPFLRLTEFLSTQSSATSATTRPALTSLFLRILALTPFWILLTLPPLHVVTTRRVLLVLGTLGLSWHSRLARVTRTILWRSRTIRNALSVITGLTFAGPLRTAPIPQTLTTRTKETRPATPGISANAKPGVRFAFTLYENQRRWLGLGWTASLLSYERQAWTDEHLTSTPDISAFELPDTESETTKWRWVPSSEWRVEGATKDGKDERSAKRIGGGGGGDDVGWVYYDNKWRDGRRVDGWDRYTRRRKWVRDAELVEVSAEGEEVEGVDATATTTGSAMTSDGDEGSISSTTAKRKGWFAGTTPKKAREKGMGMGKVKKDRSDAGSGKAGSVESVRSRDDSGDDVHTPTRYREFQWDRSIGEGVMEGLS